MRLDKIKCDTLEEEKVFFFEIRGKVLRTWA